MLCTRCHVWVRPIFYVARDSKPGWHFLNPGFRFGCHQTRVLGSGFATMQCRKPADDVYGMYKWANCVKNASIRTHRPIMIMTPPRIMLQNVVCVTHHSSVSHPSSNFISRFGIGVDPNLSHVLLSIFSTKKKASELLINCHVFCFC